MNSSRLAAETSIQLPSRLGHSNRATLTNSSTNNLSNKALVPFLQKRLVNLSFTRAPDIFLTGGPLQRAVQSSAASAELPGSRQWRVREGHPSSSARGLCSKTNYGERLVNDLVQAFRDLGLGVYGSRFDGFSMA